MNFNQLVENVREQFVKADISEIQEKLAFQFNLEGDNGGTFYVEIKDGVLSVEPYEYIDKNALFIISVDNFIKLINGKLDPVIAYSTGKLKVEGDVGKALEVKKLLKEQKTLDTKPENKKQKTQKKAEPKKIKETIEKIENPEQEKSKVEEKVSAPKAKSTRSRKSSKQSTTN